ncbi:MAG TPA: hypothetical protein VFS32_13195 [Candidatus Limnocylindrales bacterium]|nr:hypothetical protein [Candidatus Limnocylindrales bacterium]
MSDTRERPAGERVVECDGCGRALRLGGAGLVEDGAVLCPDCAPLDVAADIDPLFAS